MTLSNDYPKLTPELREEIKTEILKRNHSLRQFALENPKFSAPFLTLVTKEPEDNQPKYALLRGRVKELIDFLGIDKNGRLDWVDSEETHDMFMEIVRETNKGDGFHLAAINELKQYIKSKISHGN